MYGRAAIQMHGSCVRRRSCVRRVVWHLHAVPRTETAAFQGFRKRIDPTREVDAEAVLVGLLVDAESTAVAILRVKPILGFHKAVLRIQALTVAGAQPTQFTTAHTGPFQNRKPQELLLQVWECTSSASARIIHNNELLRNPRRQHADTACTYHRMLSGSSHDGSPYSANCGRCRRETC